MACLIDVDDLIVWKKGIFIVFDVGLLLLHTSLYPDSSLEIRGKRENLKTREKEGN